MRIQVYVDRDLNWKVQKILHFPDELMASKDNVIEAIKEVFEFAAEQYSLRLVNQPNVEVIYSI